MYASDLTTQLPGAEWLRDLRRDAAARAQAAPLPTFEAEEWRYSPIDDLHLEAFAPVVDAPAGAAPPAPALGAIAARVATVDGFLVDQEVLDPSVSITSAARADQAVDLGTSPDPFLAANAAFSPDPVVVRVPRGAIVEHPIVVTHHIATADSAVFPRLIVDVGADAQVSIVEVFTSDDVASLTVPVTDITAADAARVRFQQVQQLGGQVWQLGRLGIDVGAQATVVGGIAAVGGSYARVRTDCRLVGRGASGDLLAVYFGNGDQTLDFRTFQDHIGRDTHSNLLFKGVVDDRSTSIYTGLIQVGADAAGTNAFQTNRTIKLSPHAWAESVPNLQIENNDVRCSHASTVSPVDAEQRFYLESRGVPTSVAERLIVEGFLTEVVSELPVPAIADHIAALVQAKLDGRSEP